MSWPYHPQLQLEYKLSNPSRIDYLIFDVPYLCYRSLYTTGGLKHNNNPTGVIFGLFWDITRLTSRFNASQIVFCFDHGKLKREEEFKSYKRKRREKEKTPDEEKTLAQFRKQVLDLRTKFIPQLGYKNIFFQDGYEADDIIASVVKWLEPNEYAIIISGDKDLYQLLSKQVLVYHPSNHTVVSHLSFEKNYGIKPDKWAKVKALGGCSSDGIPGIEGIGEKTAISYLNGTLDKKKKAFQLIQNNKKWALKTFLPLVTLPYRGILNWVATPDAGLNIKAWKEITNKLGMVSLRDAPYGGKTFNIPNLGGDF